MRHLLAVLIVLCLLPAVASAASPGRKAMRLFNEAVHPGWASAIRWGDHDERLRFLDVPGIAAVDDFTRRRWEQVRVSGYRERGRQQDGDGRMVIRAEVGLINVHTQSERTVQITEIWQWLPDAGGWKLVSGLPAVWAES